METGTFDSGRGFGTTLLVQQLKEMFKRTGGVGVDLESEYSLLNSQFMEKRCPQETTPSPTKLLRS